MGESNTVVSVTTMYRHLQQYCSHPLCMSHALRKGGLMYQQKAPTFCYLPNFLHV